MGCGGLIVALHLLSFYLFHYFICYQQNRSTWSFLQGKETWVAVGLFLFSHPKLCLFVMICINILLLRIATYDVVARSAPEENDLDIPRVHYAHTYRRINISGKGRGEGGGSPLNYWYNVPILLTILYMYR